MQTTQKKIEKHQKKIFHFSLDGLNNLLDIFQYKIGIYKPRYLNFLFTRKCNSKCKFCNIWKIKEYDEADIEEIKTALSNPFLKTLKGFQITGGEPFLREDLLLLLEFLNQKFNYPEIWIPTNGIATKLIVNIVKKTTSNIKITVSLDGWRKTHNLIRGGNFFDATIETIKKLKEQKKDISIGFTISKENYKEISKVKEFADSIGVDFSCRPINISEIYYKNKNQKEKISKNLIAYLENYFNSFPTHQLSKRFYLNGIIEYLKNPQKKIVSCTALHNSFFLDEKLDIYPCLFLKKKIGNLLQGDIKKIWNSFRVQDIRKIIKKNKCPNCWVECEAYRNLRYAFWHKTIIDKLKP